MPELTSTSSAWCPTAVQYGYTAHYAQSQLSSSQTCCLTLLWMDTDLHVEMTHMGANKAYCMTRCASSQLLFPRLCKAGGMQQLQDK